MILAINTTTLQFSMTLMTGDGSVAADYFVASRSKNFNGFMPVLDFLLSSARSDMSDLEAIAAARGPGSFTGLRVGLAAAKGMAQGLGIPIIGVSSLEALACQVPFSPHPVCPLIESRKGEVFFSLFHWNEQEELIRDREDGCIPWEDLSRMIRGPALFLGNDLNRQGPRIRESFGSRAVLAPPHHWHVTASAVGVLGLKRFHKQDFDDLQELVPTYFRPPDIRPNPLPPV